MSGSSASAEPLGDEGRQVLHDWVYAEQRLLGSFDVELLERHAVAQLARALNGRRLIAVIGSGVSSGYGQPSWIELLYNMREAVEEALGIEIGSREEENQKKWLACRPVLKAAVDAMRAIPPESEPDRAPGADAIPLCFEVCENVLVELRRQKLRRLGDRDSETRREARRAAAALRDRLRWQIKDGRGRVEILLGRLLEQHKKSPAKSKLEQLRRRLWHPVTVENPPAPARDEFAASFAHVIYDRCRNGIPARIAVYLGRKREAGPAEKALKKLLCAQLRADSEQGPDTRHVVEAALYLLEPEQLAAVLKDAERRAAQRATANKEEQSEASVRPLPTLPRPDLPKHRDPLAVLLDECNVKRFLTTNYDDEILRLLESRGFEELTEANPPAGESHTGPSAGNEPRSRNLLMTPSSERAEVMVYEAGSAAFLYDYGADTREQRPQILHLHGRARTPGSWLVLSERDYRERYARDDDPSGCADDAMRLIFTANPLLFLGLGMSEPDILRPLRAFSEGVSRLCDRPAVAVLPAMDIEARRIEKQRLTLSRYGVYQLYYGHINRRENEEHPADPEPYMARLLAFQDCLRRRLQSLPKEPPKDHELSVVRAITDVEGETSAVAALKTIVRHLRRVDRISMCPDLPSNVISSLTVLNGGMKNVILTTFLTAWLANMAERWTDWLADWGSYPTPREPFGVCRERGPDGGPHEYVRHATLLRDLDAGPEEGPCAIAGTRLKDQAPCTDRFFAGAPSPAFENLRDSLRAQRRMMPAGIAGQQAFGPPSSQSIVRPPDRGRRIFYLLGERGTGRGHFFAAMRSPRRFAQICEWFGLIPPDEAGSGEDALQRTCGIDRIFFNLGLSHEVISTFDRLTWVLETTAAAAAGTDGDRVARDCLGLRGDRLGRLNHALKCLAELGSTPQHRVKRLVLAINHVSVFFDAEGEQKNAQVGRLFERLVSPDYKSAPIDFIFFVNEEHLPASLRKAPGRRGGCSIEHVRPPKLPTAEESHLRERMERSFGRPGAAAIEARRAALLTVDDRDLVDTYVHFLQRMRPATLAVRFFPRTAAALLHLSRLEPAANSCVTFADTADKDYPNAKLLRFPFGGPAIRNFQIGVRNAFERELAGPTQAGQRACADIENLMLRILDQYVESVAPGRSQALSRAGEIEQAVDAILKRGAPNPPEPQDTEFFDTIATAVGHNRYAMTVVLAAIDDMIARRLPGVPRNVVDLYPVRDFIERLRRNTVGRPPDTREDLAVKLVLELYRSDQFSALGKKLQTQVPGLEQMAQVPTDLLSDLQEKILVTLALIGQPVELRVLTGVETVAAALEKVANHDGLKAMKIGEEKACPILPAMMDLLVQRCLVYRVGPKMREENGPAALQDRGGHRFATHKAIRRHIFRQFKAPNIDYSQVDQLTVSLYATQPDDLPRPTAEGHRRVRNLIDQLSLFEKSRDEPGHSVPDPYLELANDLDGEAGGGANTQGHRRELRRARLRAAYGALRSIYSVGVVARFSTYEHEGLETPESGYFETHRQRVRWMLRLAARLDGQLTDPRAESRLRGDEALQSVRGTFHAEEIVWLFNECGVISLAQGRFSDAVALLIQARRIAKSLIEKRGWGALHARIDVNLAIAEIERGRLREAVERLERVRDEGENETKALVAISQGYLALIDDLRGDQPSANARYRTVIKKLIEIKRYRSAAIFSVQHAECLQRLGGRHLAEAASRADQAASFAAKGGHEDIRHLAELARISLEISDPDRALPVERRRQYEAQLAEIDTYARTMGAPRIVCRVALGRSEFALQVGDYRGAAAFAQEAMQIATRHDMELRKIGAMTLLGTAMFRLDLPQARTLLLRARDLAYHVDYLTHLKRIEAILS